MTGEADKAVKAQRFQCDNCGAEQAYDAALGKLKCAHCGAARDVPIGTGTVVEYDFFQGLELAPKGLAAGSGTRASKCQECGANVVFAGGSTATRCTFCGSSKVLEQEENQNAIRPESLLPFAVDKKRANQAFGDWMGKLWFRPGDLKKQSKLQEVAGVYVPFWTYDAHVESSWTAEAGYYYYETEEYTTQENGETVTKERQVQRTNWERAWGHRGDEFDDVLICASQGLPRELSDAMHTFDTQQLVPYSPGFLAGWRAEEYGVDLAGGFGFAQEKMDGEQQKRCAHDVLLPLWIAAYRYRNKTYRFLVNGQTGEVVGKAPWSYLKIALLVVSIVALAFILYYFFGRQR